MPYRLPVAPPKNRLPLLADVTIKTPCKVPWDAMVGDDRARFCCTCSKNVYDLSAMTEDEAESFLAVHLDDENACVRLYRRSDGTVLTTDCPVGATRRHRARVTLAASAAAVAITAVAAAAADVHVPRAHSPLHGQHERLFEPPRAPGGTPERYVIPNASPEQFASWGREESSRQGFANYRTGPSLRQGVVQVSTGLPPEVVSRITRQHFGRFRLCYEDALRENPHIAGRVVTRFTILRDGAAATPVDAGSDLPDASVVRCIVHAFHALTFPSPEGGVAVTVTHTLILNPND